jgi:CspA family cold shock protein
MPEGKVIFFNMKSRFGFIKENNTGIDYYFSIKKPVAKIETGDKVTFEIRRAKKGFEAFDVKVVSA